MTNSEQYTEGRTVVVVETGEYEQRGIDFVAETRDAAVRALKRRYRPPYRVTWRQPDDEGITADFEAVPGYSTKHTSLFDFTEYEVEQ